MNLLTDPVYYLSPVLIAIITFILVLLVYRISSNAPGKRQFMAYLSAATWWCINTFFMRMSPDLDQALMWDKIGVFVFHLSFVIFYHFTLEYTGARKQKAALTAAYISVVVLGLLVPSNIIVSGMRLDEYGFAPNITTVGLFLGLIDLLLMVSAEINLIYRYKNITSFLEKNRLIYLIIALAFPLAGGFLDGFTTLPPMFIWMVFIFIILCSIAIIKYQLLDIRIIIKKSISYLIISTIIAIPFITIFFILNLFISSITIKLWINVLAIFILSVIFRPLYNWLQNTIDRIFFRDRYNYIIELERFNQEINNLSFPDELGQTACRLIKGALRSSQVYLALADRNTDEMLISSAEPYQSANNTQVFKNNGLLIKWLKNHTCVIFPDDFNISPQLQAISYREYNYLKSINASLIYPIRNPENEPAGFLILSNKLSDQPYNEEDKRILSTLTNHIGTKIGNTMLFEDALKTRKYLLSWLNAMSDFVIIIGSDFKIQFMNIAATNRFGDAVHHTCWNTIGFPKQCYCCPFSKLIDSFRPYTVDIQIDNSFYDVAYAQLLNPDGSIAIIEVLRDVTDKKKIEEDRIALERKAQLASRLATVGEMVAGIAHEINNPLTAILGYTDLLLRKKLPADIKKDLDIIYTGGKRVESIVSRLMLFSRQSKPMRDLVNINEILLNTLELRIYQTRTRNITVNTDLDSDLPYINADAGQLQQVFHNIISNAEIEMNSAHGNGILDIKTNYDSTHIHISFKDNGPGISPQNMQKIFQPFFTTREVGKGTGLGLSICHGIITEHNGSIHAESEPGQGTIFIVDLPIQLDFSNTANHA